MNQFDELIHRHHANGLFVDTNLLVLYLVGLTSKQRIPTFKRTQMYAVEDFELLQALVSRFVSLVTTPHVLTEVSNLAALHGSELRTLRTLFKETVNQMLEFYDESRTIAADALFERLGLTDAAIATLCRRSMLVVTDDLELHVALLHRGVDTINFNHIRTFYWRP